jgi:drug/metabolite transporter (DMT)-like permease
MTSGVSFALLSLCFAGLNDVAFKRYSTKDRSRGMLVFGIGLVWALLQCLTFLWQGAIPQTDLTTLIYGLVTGVVLAVSNLLLIEGLTHIEVSLGSTIYRLNTIGVVLFSILILHEDFRLMKVAGIGSGVLAVLLLAHQSRTATESRSRGRFLGIVLLASLLRAVYGVVSKAGLNHGANADTMLLIAAGSWVIGGVLYARLRESRFQITGKKAAYSIISGVLVYLIVNFLIAAVARGEASVVIPIANLSFVAALLISVVLGMERLSAKKLVAVGCAIGSIWLLSQP